jgi:hypothetical protein
MKTILNTNLNWLGYAAFVLAGILFYVFKEDYSNASIYLALALVFDPFDHKVSYKLRPMWQKIWLVGHMMVAIAVFVQMMVH